MLVAASVPTNGAAADTSNATQYTYPTISLAADTVAIAQLHTSHASAQSSPTSVTMTGRTWTLYGTVTDWSSGTFHRILLYTSSGAAVSSQSLVANFAGAQAGCTLIMVEVSGVPTTNNGADAIVQAKTNTGSTSTIGAAFNAALSQTHNAVLHFYGSKGGGSSGIYTPHAAGAELADIAHSGPPTNFGCQWFVIGQSTPTVTQAGNDGYGSLAVELNCSWNGRVPRVRMTTNLRTQLRRRRGAAHLVLVSQSTGRNEPPFGQRAAHFTNYHSLGQTWPMRVVQFGSVTHHKDDSNLADCMSRTTLLGVSNATGTDKQAGSGADFSESNDWVGPLTFHDLTANLADGTQIHNVAIADDFRWAGGAGWATHPGGVTAKLPWMCRTDTNPGAGALLRGRRGTTNLASATPNWTGGTNNRLDSASVSCGAPGDAAGMPNVLVEFSGAVNESGKNLQLLPVIFAQVDAVGLAWHSIARGSYGVNDFVDTSKITEQAIADYFAAIRNSTIAASRDVLDVMMMLGAQDILDLSANVLSAPAFRANYRTLCARVRTAGSTAGFAATRCFHVVFAGSSAAIVTGMPTLERVLYDEAIEAGEDFVNMFAVNRSRELPPQDRVDGTDRHLTRRGDLKYMRRLHAEAAYGLTETTPLRAVRAGSI